MNIIGFADIHSNIDKIKFLSREISGADLIILIGDITHYGKKNEIVKILDTIGEFNTNIIGVSGNCDYIEVETELKKRDISLHRNCIEINSTPFIGVRASLFTPFNTPNEVSENDYEIFLKDGIAKLPSGKPFVLVSHQPPFNTKTDILSNGKHSGSRIVRNFIEKYQPVLCMTGHIHESVAIDKIGDTTIVNPGPLGRNNYCYVSIQNSIIEEIQIKNF